MLESDEKSDETIEMIEAHSSLNFDQVSSMNDVEIQTFTDSRGLNLLMLASEAGHIEAVQNLINRGEDVNHEVNGETAASLAYDRGHHQVLLALLHANSKIPQNFNEHNCSDEVKNFVKVGADMHEKVQSGEENLEEFKENLQSKVENFPNLRHFYNAQNNSLLKTAILSKTFAIYEILLTFNIFLAPHESMDEIVENLTEDDQRKFRDINFKISPDLVTEDLMILMRNCKLSPDNPKQSEYLDFIRKAFEFLFKIPQISIVLKIVAACRNFKIILDFKRDTVTFLDPSAEPFTNGLFYLNGKIYIAAKDMLDPSKMLQSFAVIAHELSHFAFFLCYKNEAKPYKEKNSKAERDFDEILDDCDKKRGREEIIDLVFDYDYDMQHAELIVRVNQILATYFDAKEILREKVEDFKSLFDFYDENCMPEMERKLPKIREKFSPFKKEKRYKKFVKVLMVLLVFGIIGSLAGFYAIYDPSISWNELDDDQRITVKRSIVNFHEVDVEFGELFANDTKAYELISSEQLKGALRNDMKLLSQGLKKLLGPFVYLSWSNMTDGLRLKLLTKKVEFQGEIVELGEILRNSPRGEISFENRLQSFDVKKTNSPQNNFNSKSGELDHKRGEILLDEVNESGEFENPDEGSGLVTDYENINYSEYDDNSSSPQRDSYSPNDESKIRGMNVYNYLTYLLNDKTQKRLKRTNSPQDGLNSPQSKIQDKTGPKSNDVKSLLTISDTNYKSQNSPQGQNFINREEFLSSPHNEDFFHKDELKNSPRGQFFNKKYECKNSPCDQNFIEKDEFRNLPRGELVKRKDKFLNSPRGKLLHLNQVKDSKHSRVARNSPQIQHDPPNLTLNTQNSPLNLSISSLNALNLLTPLQIRSLFNDHLFIIPPSVTSTNDIFIKRFFIDESTEVVNEYDFQFMFYKENPKSFYLNGRIKSDDPEILNFDDVLDELESEKIFLLSSVAGEGKSTTFKKYALELKEKFKGKWVQFLDLKNYTDAFKVGESLNFDDEILRKFLGEILLNLESFELELFNHLFDTQNLIFLFDGVDEISPLYKNFIIKLSSGVKSSKNFQLISTRPQHSQDLRKALNVKAFKLVPFEKFERFHLLAEFVTRSENFSLNESEIWELYQNLNTTKVKVSSKIIQKISNGQKLFDAIENKHEDDQNSRVTSVTIDGSYKRQFKDRTIQNPLVVLMVSEIAVNDENLSTSNLFDIYETFIKRKFKIIHEKGKVVQSDTDEIASSSSINVMQVHQAYAVKLIFANIFDYSWDDLKNITNLEISKNFHKLSNNEISRYGILQVFPEDFNFVHRTFAEFLCAKFFIDNINEIDVTLSDGKLKLWMFNSMLFDDYQSVRGFLKDYTKVQRKFDKFFQFWFELNQKVSKVKKVTKLRRVLKLVRLSAFADHFERFHGVSQEIYHKSNADILAEMNFNMLVEFFDKFEEILGQNVTRAMLQAMRICTTPNFGSYMNEGLLNKTTSDETFEKFYLKVARNFNSTEILPFVSEIIEKAALRLGEKCKILLKIVAKFMTKVGLKNLLTVEFSNALLYVAASNEDSTVFMKFLELYDRTLTQKEIRESLTENYAQSMILMVTLISENDQKKINKTANFLRNSFQNETLKLREFLTQNESQIVNIFTTFYQQNSTQSNFKIFEDLLREIFDDKSEFEEAIKELKIKKNLKMFEMSEKDARQFEKHKWDKMIYLAFKNEPEEERFDSDRYEYLMEEEEDD